MTMNRSKITAQKSNDVVSSGAYNSNYASYLPAVYTGFSNRVDRYRQYDQMDQDPEIKTALDILADFCTQNTEDFEIPFEIHYKDKMGESEVTTIEDRLQMWCDTNNFKIRMYEIVRGVLKYGDQFFVRDPETLELYYVNPMNIDKIVVNEKEGKKPIIYYIRDISINIRDKVVTNTQSGFDQQAYPGSMPNSLAGSGSQYGSLSNGAAGGSATDSSNPFGTGGQQDILPVSAEHVVHISLNTGLDPFWPFGTSILESIFKTYKQKELLEDSIIIYRVQRAPERRVFKIDVGDALPHQAMATVERLKNEIHQRRLPSNKGGTTSLMDAAYNPLSILEDYFFPVTADGRGSSVETLPGGENLGQIDDLRYFNNKLIRGLSIPSSYLPFGPEDGGTLFQDGGVGRALIQEHRFNKQCQRYQNIIVSCFDEEFKRFLISEGYNVDTSSFEVVFRPPMNFAAYRKTELDATYINTYMPLNDLPYISKQIIMKKMGFTEQEMIENEKFWQQENPEKMNGQTVTQDEPAGLQSVGISSPNEAGGDLDLNTEDAGNLSDAEGMSASPVPDNSGFNPSSLGDSF